jgi:hypothetical protein
MISASNETAVVAPARRHRLLPVGVALELVLFVWLVGICAPFFGSLFLGRGPLAALEAARAHRLRTDVTGFVMLAMIASQFALSAGKRLASARAARRWRWVHRLTGLPLLAALVVHTAGSAGSNMNRALLMTIVGMCLVAQLGHVFKAHARATSLENPSTSAVAFDQALNGAEGRIHRAGFQLHVVLATAVALLVVLHVVVVYWY